ncbi:MAG: acyl--CoA ligase [Deltaproteobacteria bacterium]|nr:acyl--CoA ligase [Deltaproteobacteria bacterium]MBW2445167.1 acyl--CoA ligase [Deltaproteobacteria bacterium]
MSTPTYEQAIAGLTAPGAPFEIVTETVVDRPMRLFKNRERSMREKITNAGERGDLDCFVQGERRIGYGDVRRLAFGASRQLARAHGFERGDRFAVLAYNSPDWILSLFGAVSLGGVGVGLNGWWTAEEIEYGINDSGSRYLVVDERLYPRVESLAGKLPSLETIFFIGDDPPPGTVPIDELLVPHDDAPDGPIDEDDPFIILYTSGTTGRPKGCITTHRGTIAQITGIVLSGVVGAVVAGVSPVPADGAQTASLLTSPLFHVGGLHSNLCAGLTTGAKMVFTEGKFDAEQVMQLIERERINVWGAIPTMLHRVVHHPKVEAYDLSSIARVSFGGAPTPPETIERAREVLPIEPTFANAYGLTETHGVATVNGGKDLLEKKTSIGRPMPLLDMEAMGEDGEPVPDGELGELWIRGPLVTPGYWNRPEATAEAIQDGWLHTGDLAYRDADGFFFVVDRAKDMIIRGGENVYCVEIENCLAEHPEIDEAAIVGVPDAEFGERVKAIVRRVPGSELSESAARKQVADHLAAFKVPEFVEFIDHPLPRNAAGKILKNVLRGTGDVPFDPENLT